MIKKVEYINKLFSPYMTHGKVYEVIQEDFGEVMVIDDDGDKLWVDLFCLKIIEEDKEEKKTLLEYFMELHDLKEGDIFQLEHRGQCKIEDGKLLMKSNLRDKWIVFSLPLHIYSKIEITKNET